MSGEAFDQLWQSLGLDDAAGTAGTFQKTRRREWSAADTHLVGPPPAAPRSDLPRLHARADELLPTSVLGEGGMGRVLAARQTTLNREVAVKIVKEDAGTAATAAMVHEALMTGALEHPGVIPVYALATGDDGRPALVMKRVEGTSWAVRELPLDRNIEVLMQVCNAIAFAHRKGVLHRDLKPANVLLGEFGEVYVADWGIARLLRGPVQAASLVGTPAYLAPEMVTGDDTRVDERTDVFLLGAVLYEILTGAPPWGGESFKTVLETAWRCEPKPLPSNVPAELRDICLKAMAREKPQRFASALELREALSDYLKHRSSAELSTVSLQRLDALRSSIAEGKSELSARLLSECRFGFTQALREWPGNEAARRGLHECLVLAVRYELSRGHPTTARELASELEQLPPKLKAELDEAAENSQRAKVRTQRLEQLGQELDPRVSARERVSVFVISAVGAVLVMLSDKVPAIHRALAPWELWTNLAQMVAVLFFFGIAIFWSRRTLLASRVNRRLVGVLALTLVGMLFSRLVTVLDGRDARAQMMHDFVVLVLMTAAAGITITRTFFWCTAQALLFMALAWFWIGQEGALLNLAGTISMLIVAVSWRTWSDATREKPGAGA